MFSFIIISFKDDSKYIKFSVLLFKKWLGMEKGEVYFYDLKYVLEKNKFPLDSWRRSITMGEKIMK